MALRAEEALEKSLKVEIDAMAKDADRLDGLVARAQAAIDKRQNVIELRQQQLADLGDSFRQLNLNDFPSFRHLENRQEIRGLKKQARE